MKIKLTPEYKLQLCNLYKSFTCLLFILFCISSVSAQNCTVNAGILNETICENNTLTLVGSTSGMTTGNTLWAQISGPSVIIDTPTALVSTVTGAVGGNTYVFRFSELCGDGNTAFQDKTVVVEPITIAIASADLATCPSPPGGVILTGNVPLNPGEFVLWNIPGGNGAGVTINNPNSNITTLTLDPNSCGTTTLEYTIQGPDYTPGLFCFSIDTVDVTNYGGVTSVNAGADQPLSNCYSVNQSTTLAGTFGGCGLGSQSGLWSFVSGPSIPTITDATQSNTAISGLIEGTYVMNWTVSGPCATGSDTVSIIVPPATQDVTDVSGGNVTLAICDANVQEVTLDGALPQYANETVAWAFVSGPVVPVIANSTNPSTLVTGFTVTGTYTFSYTLTNTITACTSTRNYRVRFYTASQIITANTGNDIIGTCGQTVFDIPFTYSGGGSRSYQIVSGPAAAGPYPLAIQTAGGTNVNETLTIPGTYIMDFSISVGGQMQTNCQDGFDSINIIVSGVPIPTNAGTDVNLPCGDTATTLTGNVIANAITTWSQISGPNTATIVSPYTAVTGVSGLIPGSYVFQYESQGGGNACPVSPSQITINVSAGGLSAVVAGADQNICPDALAYLSASVPTVGETGTWSQISGPDIIIFSDVNDPLATASGFSTLSSAYVLEWTIAYTNPGAGCLPLSNSTTVTINTGAIPSPTLANAGPDICLASGTTNVNLAGNAVVVGETGSWTVVPAAGVTFAPNANTPNAIATVPGDGAYTFTWTITNGGACADTFDAVEVLIAPNATANAGGDQQICATTATMAATVSAGATGTWTYVSGPGGFSFTSVNDPLDLVTFTTSGVYVFDWIVDAGICSSATDQVEITIDMPIVTAAAGPDQDRCDLTFVNLAGNAFDPNTETGAWSLISGPNSPTFTDATDPLAIVSGMVTGVYVFQWEVSGLLGSVCTSSTDTVTIEVSAPISAGSNQTICNDTTVALSGTANTTGTWSQTAGPAATVTQSPVNSYQANASGLIPGTYTFEYDQDDYTFVSTGTCPKGTATVNITIEPRPTIDPDAGADITMCNPDVVATATMTGNSVPVGSTGQWVIASEPGGSVAVITTPTSPTTTITSLTVEGLYVLEWEFTSTAACQPIKDVMRIQVSNAPTIANAGVDDLIACQTTFQTLANTPASGLGTWTITTDPSAGATTVDSPNNPQTTLSNIVVGTYVLTWTIDNGPYTNPSLCEPSLDTVTVIFNDVVPTTADAGIDQTLCAATDTNMAAVPVTSGIGTWTQTAGPVGASIAAANSPNSLIFGLTTGTYEYTWTSTTVGMNGCVFQDTMEIIVLPPSAAAVAGPDQCVAAFTAVTMAATPAAPNVGTWTQVSGPTAVAFIDANDPVTNVVGTDVGIYVFQWAVDNGACGTAVDTVSIQIKGISDLELTKSVLPTSADVGDTVTFMISVFNNDAQPTNIDVTGVSVEDVIPLGYSLVPGTISPVGAYNVGSQTITWSGLAIANGATTNLTFDVTINAAGPYVNNAQIIASDNIDIDSDPASDETVDDLADALPDDDEDTAAITIQSADLSVDKVVAPTNVSVGDAVVFTITVANAGTHDATNVSLTDQLPAGYTYVSDDAGGNYISGSGIWNIGTVDTVTPAVLNITATVNTPTGTAGEYLNVTEISAADQTDPDSTPKNDDGDQSEDDEDNATVTLQDADLELTKTVLPTSGSVGDTVTFSVQIYNNGPGNGTGIEVLDLLPSGYDLVGGTVSNGGVYNLGANSITWSNLTVANGGSFTVTYDATVNGSGNYTNIAEITASDLPDPDSTPDNDDGDQSEDDEDNTTFTIEQIDLELTKGISVASSATPNVGDTITFELTIDNNGPDDATGISIADMVPVGYTIGVINNGGVATGNQIDWSGLAVANGASLVVSYDVVVLAPTGLAGEYTNTTEITGADQFDVDSTPDNDDGDQSEDDEDLFVVTPQTSDLSITKLVSDGTPNVGDVVTFTVNVSNAGSVAATGVSVQDVVPVGYTTVGASISGGGILTGSTIDWTGLSVPLGVDTVTLTFDATVNAPTGSANEYLNEVEITASDQFDIDSDPTSDATVDDLGDGISDDDEATVGVVIQESDLSIVKSISNMSPNVGDTVTFTLVVTNEGPDVATNVAIEDILPIGYTLGVVNNGGVGVLNTATWTGLTVAANSGTVTVTYDALVLAPTGAVGEYTNSTQITASDQFDPDSDVTTDNTVDEDGDGNGDDDDEDVLTIIPATGDLSLTKVVTDGNYTPVVGGQITFDIVVTNDGLSTATGVEVLDLLPNGYTYVNHTVSSGFYTPATGVWDGLDNMPNGTSQTLTVTVIVLPVGDYHNIAEVIFANEYDADSVHGNGIITEDDMDDAIVIPVAQNGDLSLIKVVTDGNYSPIVGDQITFDIVVTNDGPQTATGVDVLDLLPTGYAYVSHTVSSGFYTATTGLWDGLDNMPNGTSQTLTITATVLPTGNYTNIAEVMFVNELDADSVHGNGVLAEDDMDDAVVTPVAPVADLSLTKGVIDGDINPLVGSEITFIITVTNDGPQDATGVDITDLLPSGFDFVLFSSTTGVYNEITGVWTVGNIANGATETLLIDVLVNGVGNYHNIAEVTASDVIDVDSTPNNDDGDQSEDDEDGIIITPVPAMADLSLVKTVVDNDISPSVGDEITFQITVSNAGPDAATNVEVIDLLPVGFDFVLYSSTSGLYDDITGLWTVGTIPSGATQTLFIDVIVNAPTGALDEYLNVSEITTSDVTDPNSTPNNDDGDQSEDDEDNVQIIVEISDLSLTKSLSNIDANVGDVVTFTLQIDNLGPDVATGVALQDILPIGFSSITSISDGGILTGNTIDWTNLIVPLTGLTITYEATVNIPTLALDEYLNIAQIMAVDQFDPNSTADNDDGDQSEDDEANAELNTPTTDIEVTKSVDISNPAIGDEITFTISASNIGSLDATTVEIDEVLPSGYEFISYTATSGVYDVITGIWEIPTVTTNTNETLSIIVKVLDVDDYVNTASLMSLDQIDSDGSNDSDDSTIDPICLSIYNEFSPNDDGVNDVFYIDCLANFPNNKLEVYNRWGNIVYSKKGYDNTFKGLSNGRAVLYKEEKLPVGTYYYVLDLGDGSKNKTGWLYINR